MTVQAIGASPFPAIGGWRAQATGYHAAFFLLGSFVLASLALWIGLAGTLRPASAGWRGVREKDAARDTMPTAKPPARLTASTYPTADRTR